MSLVFEVPSDSLERMRIYRSNLLKSRTDGRVELNSRH